MKDKNGNIIYCIYGCGQEANYLSKHGIPCCSKFNAQCPAIRKKNSERNKERIHKEIQNGNYKNPFETYICKHGAWNKGLTKFTDERVRKMGESYSDHLKQGKFHTGHLHTEAVKEKLSITRIRYLDQFENGFPHVAYYNVTNIQNESFKVRGTWERNVANILTDSRILWLRNRPLRYFNNGNHYYQPDFYLPSTREYIEVKGYYSEKDKVKLNCILIQYPEIKIYFLNDKNYHEFLKFKQLKKDYLLKLKDTKQIEFTDSDLLF